MSTTIRPVRVHYTYFDNREGLLQGSIDLHTEGNRVRPKGVKAAIIEKWQRLNYTGAIYDSIEIIDYE